MRQISRTSRRSSTALRAAWCLGPLLLAVAACGDDAPAEGPPDPGAAKPLPPVLMPPASGVQIASPEFVLQPGEEVFKCYHTTVPVDTEVAVNRFKSVMTPGSHHLILYGMQEAGAPDGTFEDCGRQAGTPSLKSLRVWLYASQKPEDGSVLPEGVAMPFKARQPVMLNLHYLNASSKPLTVRAAVNAEYVSGSYQRAGAFITFNTNIAIPAQGTQTVSGRCKLPAGGKFFSLSTHSHRYTTSADVSLWQGGKMMQELVSTNDWEHPTIRRWEDPFLTAQAGQELQYSCAYKNTTDQVIKVGESASEDEMCMAIGYYFPATKNTFCLNSNTISL